MTDVNLLALTVAVFLIALLAIPCAYLGGGLNVPAELFKRLLAAVLLSAGTKLLCA